MLVCLKSKLFKDNRGWFSEIYNFNKFKIYTEKVNFIQDNQSYSQEAGTLRGLHFQLEPHPQAKLVRCLSGAIFDVAVDIRLNSPTYGKWIGIELSADNGKQLYIPSGFAHGFLTLVPDTMVFYKVSNYYAQDCDRGLAWDDKDIGIDWPLLSGAPILSSKDSHQQTFQEFQSNFEYNGEPMSLREVVL